MNSWEELKQAMKQELKEKVDAIWNRRFAEMDNDIDEIATKFAMEAFDDKRLQEIDKILARAKERGEIAKDSAEAMAISLVSKSIMDEISEEIQPNFERIAAGIIQTLKDFELEAITELIIEKFKKES